MKEELLHYIWQQKFLVNQPLKTTAGQKISIIKPGSINTDAGPDFFNAHIRIEDTLWVGNVELHIKSSDWIKHQHHVDEAYNNVILHVVFEHDAELGIPTLELKNYLPQSLLHRYLLLQQQANFIPCENVLALPESFKLKQFLYRIAVERLSHKCSALEQQLQQLNQHWESLLYHSLAKYFGMRVNAEPFMLLAKQLPMLLLQKHKHSKSQIDALIFGTAGFLNTPSQHQDVLLLNREFHVLQTKYQLNTLHHSVWKFAKTRPVNFPTNRLAQFSSLVFEASHLFSKLMESTSLEEACRLLQTSTNTKIPLNELYPANHVALKPISKPFAHHLMINVVVPIKFLFGKHMQQPALCDQALDWLEQIPGEINFITRFWKQQGVQQTDAMHSQALIHLHNHYCKSHKCLNCAIGHHILQHA
ncbi:MAG: DUF2851 family protein [Bacteroidota bacterium]